MNDYPRDFYDDLIATAAPSAGRIVPLVRALMTVDSVVDVGCGTGAWLKAFADNDGGDGAKDVLGLDGEWVRKEQLLIAPGDFQRCDLTKTLPVDRTFDLAISLEVAEHFEDAFASGFIGELTRLAPVILFSAAIPGQGGLHHVNEQPPAYWAELFAERGFQVIDTLRWQVWSDPDVTWWYQQNIMLFASDAALSANPKLASARQAMPPNAPIHAVHPERYAAMVRQTQPGLGGWLKMGRRAIGRSLPWRRKQADTR